MKTLIFALILAQAHAAKAQVPGLQTGDLIFHTSTSRQANAIMKATDSPYSHVGLIENDGSTTYVVEAVQPVKRTKLQDWIKRGAKQQFAIYRNDAIPAGGQQQILEHAKTYLGRNYDIHFTSGNDNIYCSELVDYAYRDSGFTIGSYQKIKELRIDRDAVKELAEQRWKTHPLCKNVRTFDQCWDIILEDELITPANLASAPQLELIFSNY